MNRLRIWLFAAMVLHSSLLSAGDFPYNIRLKAKPVNGLTGLHSYVSAQSGGKILILGGRLDGIHARQPFNAFSVSGRNTSITVIDPVSGSIWQKSVAALPADLQEQMMSTNMNFCQEQDTLYITGGYGYSAQAADHRTYPFLTTVLVPALIDSVVRNGDVNPCFKQIRNDVFAVTGGQLGHIDGHFYLVGGHRFDGRYNPMGNPTYTQTYTSAVRKFRVNNSGTQLSYGSYTEIKDDVHLHRRDYNLLPWVFTDRSFGYLLSSGVFRTDADLPYLYPVEIRQSGQTALTGFNQYLSNYHSATVSLYDSAENRMHAVFFGGISRYYYDNGVLKEDPDVPFVKTISRLTRDEDGTLSESVFGTQMPSLLGASAEFIINKKLTHAYDEVIYLHAHEEEDSVFLGYIYGGIYSPTLNPFSNNATGTTSAHPVIYEVWLDKDKSSWTDLPDGKHGFKAEMSGNPGQSSYARLILPEPGFVTLLVTDATGRLVSEKHYENLPQGVNRLETADNSLSPGIYHYTFTLNGKYSRTVIFITAEK